MTTKEMKELIARNRAEKMADKMTADQLRQQVKKRTRKTLACLSDKELLWKAKLSEMTYEELDAMVMNMIDRGVGRK